MRRGFMHLHVRTLAALLHMLSAHAVIVAKHTSLMHPCCLSMSAILQPVMVLGSAASAATLLLFGLSGSYAGAASARVVAGLLNGIIVSWKCSIGESCQSLEQGRVRELGEAVSGSWEGHVHGQKPPVSDLEAACGL